MAVNQSIIPCRFLSLTAHLVITVMLFWSREANILACIPNYVGINSSQYSTKDTQLIVGLSLSLLCLIVELGGLLSGLSMFSHTTNMFSIATHISASITLSLYVINSWSCDLYWFIFGFCCLLPVSVEVIVVLLTLKNKVFT